MKKDKKITFPCYGIVPARYGSQRFPGKPLIPLFGKPMFWHVVMQARQCPLLENVVVATDDERILSKAQALKIPALMTRAEHPSGTDRVLEAARLLGLSSEAVVINIQGDEPALEPKMLTQLLGPFIDSNTQVATLACKINQMEARGTDQVKVVFSARGRALYFSRTPIPYPRDGGETPYYGHVGVYAFRMSALESFASLSPSRLEKIERLEQLRMLENDIPIQVVVTPYKSRGIDRPEDVEPITQLMIQNKQASLTQP